MMFGQFFGEQPNEFGDVVGTEMSCCATFFVCLFVWFRLGSAH